MSAIVSVRGLGKTFEDRKRGLIHALRDVTFSCGEGRVYGLLGPNGAGKTTALRILSTMLRPTSGSASINGFDVQLEPEKVRGSIGFLSSATGLYERSTAKEILEFFGSLYGMGKTQLKNRVEELASLFQMEEFLDQACGRLSAGQRQKVNISRGIVHDPPVIILDEPTANLDVLVAREVIQFIQDERTKGKSILLSTHVMSEVDRLCDDLAIIHRGRVLLDGSLAGLLQAHGCESIETLFFDLIEKHEQESEEVIQ